MEHSYGHHGLQSGRRKFRAPDNEEETVVPSSVLEGKVWAYDSDMSLYLSAKDGKLIWKVNVEHDGINPRWENACSPLIVDDLVIIYGGGQNESFLAFDKIR